MDQINSLGYRNNLLNLIPRKDFHALSPSLEHVVLEERHILERPQQKIEFVYFIETGVASIVAFSPDGKEIEIGLVGYEGMSGGSLILGDTVSPFECYTQMKGSAYRLPADAFMRVLEQSAPLTRFMNQYARMLWIQTGYTALSNGKVKLEARLARWLLMVHDRMPGDNYEITHEFLALMLGARRPGVTTALHALEGAGAIRSRRKMINIRNRERLKHMAGGVYGLAEKEYERLLGLPIMRMNWTPMLDVEFEAYDAKVAS